MDICFSLVVIRGVERVGGWVGACGVVFYLSRLDGAHFSCFLRYPLFLPACCDYPNYAVLLRCYSITFLDNRRGWGGWWIRGDVK